MPQPGRRISMPRVICLFVPFLPLVMLLGGCASLGRSAPSSLEQPEGEPSLQLLANSYDGTNPAASPDDAFSAKFPDWTPSLGTPSAQPLPKEWRAIAALTEGYAVGISKRGRVVLLRSGARTFQELFALPSPPTFVGIDPAGRVLAAALPDRIALFSLANGREVISTTGVHTRLTDMAFDRGGAALLCAGADGYVYVWDIRRALSSTGPWQKQLERYAPGDIPGGIAVHPQGRVFFVGTWNGGVSAFLRYNADAFGGEYDAVTDPGATLRAPTTVVKAAGPNDAVTQLRIAGSGDRLIVARQSGVLEIWKVRGFQKLGEGRAHSGAIYDLAVSADGRRVVTVGRDGFLRTWSVEDCMAEGESCDWLPRRSMQLPGARLVAMTGAAQALVARQEGELSWLAVGEDARS